MLSWFPKKKKEPGIYLFWRFETHIFWWVGEGWVWAGKCQAIQESLGILLALEESSGEEGSRVGIVGSPVRCQRNCSRVEQKENPCPKGRTALLSSAGGREPGGTTFMGFLRQTICSPGIPSHADHVKHTHFPGSLFFSLCYLSPYNSQVCLFLIAFPAVSTGISHSASLFFSEGMCIKTLHLNPNHSSVLGSHSISISTSAAIIPPTWP